MLIIAWLLGAALSASAHDLYPIRPVRATVLAEPDRIVVDLRADSIIWIEEVARLHPMPPGDWPAETLEAVEAYADSHFRLEADGRRLPGRLAEARYRQLPWEVNEEGVFFLRLVYPPAPAGSTLSGAARFYEEYRAELQTELGGRPLPYAEGYRTFVEIPGLVRRSFTLTPDAPSFSVSADEARRSAAAMLAESLRRGAQAALSAAAGFPALLAAALCLGAARPSRTVVAGAAVFAAGGCLLGRAVQTPDWLIWCATLTAALAAGRGRAALAAAGAAAAALGLLWEATGRPYLPHFAAAPYAALAGSLPVGAALLWLVHLGVRAERRRLEEVSQSRAEQLFARRLRLFSTLLAMVGAYGLWQSYGGRP